MKSLTKSTRTASLFYFCLALLLTGVFAYGSALNGPLFFDDGPNLTGNDFVQIDGSRFDDWRVAALSSKAGVTRRPLAMLTFAFNYAVLEEFSPTHLKVINLLVHCLTGALVYFLALMLLYSPALAAANLGDRKLIALFATAIWFLHPLHVSTVLYAIQRMAQLSALFVVAGLLVFCRYRLRWVQRGAETGEIIAAALWLMLLTLLATFSKENGALLPWLIVVAEVTLFRGVWRRRRWPALARAGWLAFLAPLLCLALLLVFNPDIIIGRYAGREFSLEERLFTQARVLWHYLSWLVLPDISAMGFQHDDIVISRGLLQPLTTLVALLFWLALICVGWLLRHRFPLLIFAVLFYLVAHVMESSVYPLEMVYEHRNYLPAVGVAIFLAGCMGSLVNAITQLRPGVAVVGVLVILVVLLALRATTWSDEILLSRVNVENHPASPRSHFFYGNALFKRFERREELALSEKEVLELAVASRSHFEKMHEIDGRDLAPIVMLYQIDSALFPGMPDRVDWLEKLEVLLQTRRLQASDHASIEGLLDYFSHRGSGPDRRRLHTMLDDLIARYPKRVSILMHKYKLLSTQDNVSPEALLEVLEQAQRVNPRALIIYPHQMMEHYKAADMAAAYQSALDWMQQDQSRRQLSAVRRVFKP